MDTVGRLEDRKDRSGHGYQQERQGVQPAISSLGVAPGHGRGDHGQDAGAEQAHCHGCDRETFALHKGAQRRRPYLEVAGGGHAEIDKGKGGGQKDASTEAPESQHEAGEPDDPDDQADDQIDAADLAAVALVEHGKGAESDGDESGDEQERSCRDEEWAGGPRHRGIRWHRRPSYGASRQMGVIGSRISLD
jgi:hypothetical protein